MPKFFFSLIPPENVQSMTLEIIFSQQRIKAVQNQKNCVFPRTDGGFSYE